MIRLSRRPATGSLVALFGQRSGWALKVRPAAIGRREAEGWRAVRDTLPVPAKLRSLSLGRWHALLFDKCPSVGPACGLFCDLLAAGDPVASAALARDHGAHLARSAAASGSWRAAGQTETALFQSRATPKSRLGEWVELLDTPIAGRAPDCRWRINYAPCRQSARELLYTLEQWGADADGPCFTLLSQGDATEMNIGFPLTYLDFKYSGTNALLGEIATFTWSLLGQGASFVPRYNPAAAAGRPALLDQALHWQPWIDGDGIDLRLHLPVAPSRLDATESFLAAIWPAAAKLHADRGVSAFDELRPYLLSRILFTFSPRALSEADRLTLLCLALHLDAIGPDEFLGWLGVSRMTK